MNILIIEDDKDLNAGLCYSLSKMQCDTKGAYTAAQGLALLYHCNFDALILDCNLPDGDGFDLCKKVADKFKIPVILLTARDSEIDEVKGFDMGASDYVTKPFSLSVLKARINNVLRPSSEKNLYISGNITLDLEKHVVEKNEQKVELSKIEFSLLYYLMENEGRILKKENILNYIWDCNGRYVDSNVVSVNIRRLRMKIEDTPSNPAHIISIRGIGYQWKGGEHPNL